MTNIIYKIHKKNIYKNINKIPSITNIKTNFFYH